MAKNKGYASSINLPISIPPDWNTDELGNICKYIKDGDWIETKDQGGSDYRLLQISNIGVGSFVETGRFRWITEKTFSKLGCTQIDNGDILIARMPDPTGRSWYVSDLPWPAITAVDVAIVRTIPEKLDGKFLSYYLNSPYCLALVDKFTTGTTRKRIKRTDIEKLMIPLPSLPEQQAIANVLSAFDNKVNILNCQNETLEALAQTLFRQWFIEEAEDDWEVGVLPDEFDFTMGLSPPGSSYNENGVGTAMFQGNADFSFRFPNNRVYTTDPRRFAEKFDTLISVRAPVGAQNMAKEKCCIGRGVAAFRYKRNTKYHSYTYYKLNSIITEIRRFEDSGTVFGSINKSDFEVLEVFIPPPELVDKFDNEVGKLDLKILNNSLQIRTLEKLRDMLLPKLISGEIRIEL